jgi:predicted aspartyl protease
MQRGADRFLVVGVALWLTANPALGADAPEPPSDSVLADVPFEHPEEPNRVYVNLSPEGSAPFVWMLDTGASFSVMTPLAARAAKVSVRRDKSTPYRRGSRLGRDIEFVVDTQSSDTGSKTGWEYGLLGGNFLEEYVVEIDFAARRVRFLDPKKYETPEQADSPGEAVVPIQLASRRPSVEIEMNGKRLQLLLDTGAPLPAVVSGAAAKKLGVDVGALPHFGELGTVMGPMKVNLYESESFRFAGFAFSQMPVLVAPRGWYNQGGSSDSVIGYDTLSQFTLRLDYPRRRLWLKRVREDSTFLGVPYATTRAAGVFLVPGGGAFVVMGVQPGSPASEIGIRPGDVLGATLGPLNLTGVLKKVAAKEPITVTRLLENDMWDDVTLPEGGDEAGEPPALTPEQRQAQAAELEANEQAELESWKRARDERLYMEMDGSWQVIDGPRRRLGPKPGETWVTYDEMRRIMQERAAGK